MFETKLEPKLKRGWKFLPLVALIILTSWLFNRLAVAPPQAASELCSYQAEAYEGLDLAKLEEELEGTGLIGRVHGAVASSQLFVLSVREPEDFFTHREFSLIPADREISNGLASIKRHDRLCIRGQFLENPSPQKHILVQSVKVLETQSNAEELPSYQREAKIPDDLSDRTSFIGKVHAIAHDGRVLVVEYQDAILPIFVPSPEETQDLFRGDIIELSYRLQEYPDRPTHLQLNPEVQESIKVIDAIADWHDRETVLTGKLVKFPQSPQLNFDVYGIAVENQGVTRNFTLVNFEDEREFQKIRDTLAKIWDDNLETAQNGRNMLVNPAVILEARGRINVISPEQANPQILLDSTEDLKQLSS